MDDAEFLAELEKLEQGVPLKSVSASDALDTDPFDDDTAEIVPVQPSAAWTIDGFEDDPAPHMSVRDMAVAVIGFVVMMAVGAASAALLFHDRLATILR